MLTTVTWYLQVCIHIGCQSNNKHHAQDFSNGCFSTVFHTHLKTFVTDNPIKNQKGWNLLYLFATTTVKLTLWSAMITHIEKHYNLILIRFLVFCMFRKIKINRCKNIVFLLSVKTCRFVYSKYFCLWEQINGKRGTKPELNI